MERSVLEQVKIRLRQFHTDEETQEIVFDNPEENVIIEQLINQATADVKAYRHYENTSYDDEKIEEDMKKYDNVIVKLVIYDYLKEGVDFQNTYNVNESSASFINRDEILASVTPFVAII